MLGEPLLVKCRVHKPAQYKTSTGGLGSGAGSPSVVATSGSGAGGGDCARFFLPIGSRFSGVVVAV